MSDRLPRLLNSVWYSNHRLKWILWPLGFLYGGLASLRRAAYRRGWLRSIRVGVPVVVVGNLSAGGTGKTPCVVWLANALVARGFRVGVVSRGYRGAARDWPVDVGADGDPALVGDEPVLIAGRTGCPVVAGPDRVAAAERLVRNDAVDVIVSDDGMQHYRLDRDFEIAVVDGTRGLGNGWCLPAGPLRERPARLGDVGAVVVNSGPWRRPGAIAAELVAVRVVELRGGREAKLDDFAGRRIHAVAAVGNPERFFALLDAAGLDVDPRPLPDHAPIRPADLAFDDGDPVMITEKDAVKCRGFAAPGVWCVVVEMRFADGGGERLMSELTDALSLPDARQPTQR